MKGRVRIVTRRAGTDEILRTSPWYQNMIMLGTNTGKDLILDHLNGDDTYPLELGYADIGTGSTAPAASDTALETAAARALKANGSVSSNVLTLQYFFPDGDLPDDDYTEFGTFCGGTGAVDSGQIFNRVLFGSTYTKASGEDTTIEIEFTIS